MEAIVQTSSVKKVLLEISQNSQENTCTRVSFLITLQACSKNTFLHRTPPVAASVFNQILLNYDQNIRNNNNFD